MKHSSERELTHPSWRRTTDHPSSPTTRESLLGEMVRAQLIFDRRTPAGGLPAWRDTETDGSPVHLDARVGVGVSEFVVGGEPAESVTATACDDVAPSSSVEPNRFADELAQRLQLARDRVEAEHVHLTQVGTVASAYLGRPNLRLVK